MPSNFVFPNPLDSNTVWSVSMLNRTVRELLALALPPLWVRGEISNFTRAASGHCYFSLKDASAQVRCVMFRQRAVLVPFTLREGLQIETQVQVSLYEARGDFQLTVDNMRPSGLGLRYVDLEALKAKFNTEGLFEVARKKSLPTMPRSVGIVTSPQAAALHDVLITLRRRAPYMPVVLYPTTVQGADAATHIAAMIAMANKRKEVDVLIVCRGGGSIEDLWAFNEEVVVRAIAASRLPVVSGVGHETDVTLADFVADVRAATPTAAAELVAPDNQMQWVQLQQRQVQLSQPMKFRLQSAMQQLDFMVQRLVHPQARLQRKSASLTQIAQRLQQGLLRQTEKAKWQLNALSSQLDSLNPVAILQRGYSLVHDANGQLVRDAATLQTGQALLLTFAKGQADAVVSGLPNKTLALYLPDAD